MAEACNKQYWYQNDYRRLVIIASHVISRFFLWGKLSKFAFILNKLIIHNFILCNESLKLAYKYALYHFIWWNDVPGDNAWATTIVPVPVVSLPTRTRSFINYCLCEVGCLHVSPMCAEGLKTNNKEHDHCLQGPDTSSTAAWGLCAVACSHLSPQSKMGRLIITWLQYDYVDKDQILPQMETDDYA